MELPMGVAAFYGWWLLVNGVAYCAEYVCLLRPLSAQTRPKGHLPLYLCSNTALLGLTLALGLPSLLREVMHIALLCVFTRHVLGRRWSDATAPAAIVFTLSTLSEGGSAIAMRALVTQLKSPQAGYAAQMALSVLTTLVLVLVLGFVAGRYGRSATRAGASCLYLLLLPCAFVVWVIRFGLGLDGAELFSSQAPFGAGPPLWAVVCLGGAAVTFFVILEVFGKMAELSDREAERTALAAQLRQQDTYLAEAAKRGEQYRAFQHDINNHLLILSGLVQSGRTDDAHAYLARLDAMSQSLSAPVSTGRAALDVLLGEKIRYARQSGITVTWDLHLPPLGVEDIDLCIVLSNALDNAIKACIQEEEGHRRIHLTAKARHQFLLIEVTNPCHTAGPWQYGTGLRNIAQVADKYGGAAETEKTGDQFRLSVLLCCGGETTCAMG